MFMYRLPLIFTLLCSFATIARAQIAPPVEIIPEAKLSTRTNFSGTVYDAYPDGMPKSWRSLDNGMANGKWVEWYPDGTLRFRSNWRAGKGHGLWHYYYPDGQLRDESTYEMDVLHGISRNYHPNGRLAESAPYLNGKIHGIRRRWAADGTPLDRQRYEEGQMVVDRPRLFEPGTVASATANEWDLTFMPGGDTLYFYRRLPGATEGAILRSTRVGDRWGEPTDVTSDWPEARSIFLTYDGRRAFTTSYRPLAPGIKPEDNDSNIWLRERTQSGWSAPVSVGPQINRSMAAGERWPRHYEAGHTTDPAGNLYYWSGEEAGQASDLYLAPLRSDGTFGAPRPLPGTINSPGFESTPMLSPDGRYLFFAAGSRDDGYGGEDLYYSKNIDGEWTPARNLGPLINSGGNDSFPAFTPDGRYFYFSSDRDGRSADGEEPVWSIYFLESRFLPVE